MNNKRKRPNQNKQMQRQAKKPKREPLALNATPFKPKDKKGGMSQQKQVKKGGAPVVQAQPKQRQLTASNKSAVAAKKEQLNFGSDSDEEDEELTDEEMEDESDLSDGDDLAALKGKNGGMSQQKQVKKGGAPVVQAQPKQRQLTASNKSAVAAKKEQLNFGSDSDEEDEELTDEEMEDESDSSDGDDLAALKGKNGGVSQQKQVKKGGAPVVQAQPKQRQLTASNKSAVAAKKEQLNFGSDSDEEDEELTDEEMEDESDSSDGDDLAALKGKNGGVSQQKQVKKGGAPVVQAQPKQRQLTASNKSAVTAKKEQLNLGSDSDEEDEELTDEEMEDESDGDDLAALKVKNGSMSQQKQVKKDGAPVVQAQAQQPKQRQTWATQSPKYKAAFAEEERRRAERDKVTLFLRCETLRKMTEHEIKALHPDTLAVRTNNKGYCWLVFASEPAAEKALMALSKKTAIGGKELYVDRCGAKAKQQSSDKKKKQPPERPINPMELVVTHFSPATTAEQLKVVFPTATNVNVVTFKPSKDNHKRATRAIISFDNEVDTKKAFEKSAQMKIGGAPVDVFYGRSS